MTEEITIVPDVWSVVRNDEDVSEKQLAKIESVMMAGDFSPLTNEECAIFVRMRCLSSGLNPTLNPYEWINFPDKQTGKDKKILYAKKGCSEQLGAKYQLSTEILSQGFDKEFGTWDVEVRVSGPSGRSITEIGSYPIQGKKLKEAGNAKKSALTQAKRRGILSYCGQGILDESELESMPDGIKRIAPPPATPTLVVSNPAPLAVAKPPELRELPKVTGPAKMPAVKIPVAKPKN